jgi:hypothetical protein
MHIMHRKNIVRVKHDLITEAQSMQASFCEWIVDGAQKRIAITLDDFHPEILTPTSRRYSLLRKRNQSRRVFMTQNRFRHHALAGWALALFCDIFVGQKSCGVNSQFNEVSHVDLSLDNLRRYPEVLWILPMLAFPVYQLIVIGEPLVPKLRG